MIILKRQQWKYIIVFLVLWISVCYITHTTMTVPSMHEALETQSPGILPVNNLVNNAKAPQTYTSMIGPRSPRCILYNRVPKTASSFVGSILRFTAHKNGIALLHLGPHGSSALSETEEAALVHTFAEVKTRCFANKHVLLPNFTRHGKEFPEMINLIRDPFDQLVSQYYYTRLFQKPNEEWSKERIARTLDECARMSYSDCTRMNSLIPYFCGNHPGCLEKSDYSLMRAKQNVKR